MLKSSSIWHLRFMMSSSDMRIYCEGDYYSMVGEDRVKFSVL